MNDLSPWALPKLPVPPPRKPRKQGKAKLIPIKPSRSMRGISKKSDARLTSVPSGSINTEKTRASDKTRALSKAKI